MTIETILAGGFGLLKRHPRALGVWALLYLLIVIASYLVIRPLLGPLMEMQRATMAAQASGQVVTPVIPSGFWPAILFICVALLVVMAMMFAAAVRTVATGQDGRIGNLRFGGDELRLVLLGFIFVIGFYLSVFVVTILATLAIVALAAASTVAAVLVAIPIVIAIFCALVYVEVRLSLAGAMTVLRHRLVFRAAWRATKGHFWTLFATYFILFVISIVIYTVVVSLTSPWLFSALSSPQAMQEQAQQQLAEQMNGLSPMLVIRSVFGAVVVTGLMALLSGAVATAALSIEKEADPSTVFE